MHPTTIYEMSVGEHHRRLDDRHREHLAAVRRHERDEEPSSADEPTTAVTPARP